MKQLKVAQVEILGPFLNKKVIIINNKSVANFWNNNYIEYENNSDRKKRCSKRID